jgi:hypothetical protein
VHPRPPYRRRRQQSSPCPHSQRSDLRPAS